MRLEQKEIPLYALRRLKPLETTRTTQAPSQLPLIAIPTDSRRCRTEPGSSQSQYLLVTGQLGVLKPRGISVAYPSPHTFYLLYSIPHRPHFYVHGIGLPASSLLDCQMGSRAVGQLDKYSDGTPRGAIRCTCCEKVDLLLKTSAAAPLAQACFSASGGESVQSRSVTLMPCTCVSAWRNWDARLHFAFVNTTAWLARTAAALRATTAAMKVAFARALFFLCVRACRAQISNIFE